MHSDVTSELSYYEKEDVINMPNSQTMLQWYSESISKQAVRPARQTASLTYFGGKPLN